MCVCVCVFGGEEGVQGRNGVDGVCGQRRGGEENNIQKERGERKVQKIGVGVVVQIGSSWGCGSSWGLGVQVGVGG